jgi:hypothetical protein
VTSDAGLPRQRELDERLGLSTLVDRHPSDPGTVNKNQFPQQDR